MIFEFAFQINLLDREINRMLRCELRLVGCKIVHSGYIAWTMHIKFRRYENIVVQALL